MPKSTLYPQFVGAGCKHLTGPEDHCTPYCQSTMPFKTAHPSYSSTKLLAWVMTQSLVLPPLIVLNNCVFTALVKTRWLWQNLTCVSYFVVTHSDPLHKLCLSFFLMDVIMCSVMLGLVSALSCRVGASKMSIMITLNADCNSPSLRRLPSSSSCWAARREGVASTWLAPIVWWCLTQTGTLPMTTRPWRGAGEMGRKSSASSTGLSLSVLQSQGWPPFFAYACTVMMTEPVPVLYW